MLFLENGIMYKKFVIYNDGEKYRFNKVFGITYSISVDGINGDNEMASSGDVLCEYVKKPFLLHGRERGETPRISAFAKCYARLLVFLWKYFYPAVYLLSHCRFAIYKDAGEANMAFRKILKGRNQRVLCLPRSIFIATTSRRFKGNGALFIGCFLPFRHMHAWVIEDGMHADVYDHVWIQFTPLAMMK